MKKYRYLFDEQVMSEIAMMETLKYDFLSVQKIFSNLNRGLNIRYEDLRNFRTQLDGGVFNSLNFNKLFENYNQTLQVDENRFQEFETEIVTPDDIYIYYNKERILENLARANNEKERNVIAKSIISEWNYEEITPVEIFNRATGIINFKNPFSYKYLQKPGAIKNLIESNLSLLGDNDIVLRSIIEIDLNKGRDNIWDIVENSPFLKESFLSDFEKVRKNKFFGNLLSIWLQNEIDNKSYFLEELDSRLIAISKKTRFSFNDLYDLAFAAAIHGFTNYDGSKYKERLICALYDGSNSTFPKVQEIDLNVDLNLLLSKMMIPIARKNNYLGMCKGIKIINAELKKTQKLKRRNSFEFLFKILFIIKVLFNDYRYSGLISIVENDREVLSNLVELFEDVCQEDGGSYDVVKNIFYEMWEWIIRVIDKTSDAERRKYFIDLSDVYREIPF
ncbi:hypothetical protein [[Acholeplasma] multilocale]|uniref:hypothetical protein n=1 Tax=[Acholeplasma] multilocale TaxID=264638 RepID=UPI00047D190D|nr:hypothetical protein [[Acholeplasma] multilocale]